MILAKQELFNVVFSHSIEALGHFFGSKILVEADSFKEAEELGEAIASLNGGGTKVITIQRTDEYYIHEFKSSQTMGKIPK